MTRRTAAVPALPLAILLYLVLVGALGVLALGQTGGEFVYAQDDPYIHLSMARTLAEHGVWGIQPGEFASASSSPLWTLLLAGLWTLGAHAVWMPFALNVLFGIGVIAVAGLHVREHRLGGTRANVAFLAAIVLVTPLPTLAFIGMEHSLQVLLVLAFVLVTARLIEGSTIAYGPACTLAALMVATRYETLFVVAVVCGILLWQGRLKPAIVIGAASALPVVLFAWYSVAHGGLILPNSVLMKSGPGRFGSMGAGIGAVLQDWIAILNLYGRPPQLVLTIAAVLGLLLSTVPGAALFARQHWLAAVFVGTSVLHACLVKLEWFFRYEAYLIALGLAALLALSVTVKVPLGASRRGRSRPHPAFLLLLLLLGLPLAARTLSALATTPGASRNVYEQQVQLARFFREHYAGRSIAANDIGAVAWASGARLFDIVGLASQPVADLKRHRALDAAALERLASERQVEAIALYEDVFAPILPAAWTKVGEWTIPVNVAVSGRTVAFFARTPQNADRLRAALREFSTTLPRGVEWKETSVRLPAWVAKR